MSQSSCNDTLFNRQLSKPNSPAATPTALILPDPKTDAKADPAFKPPSPKPIYPSLLQSAKTYFTSRVAKRSVFDSIKDARRAFINARAGNPISDAVAADPTSNPPTSKGIYRSYLQSAKTYFTSRVAEKNIFESSKDARRAFKDARAGNPISHAAAAVPTSSPLSHNLEKY